MQDDVNAQPNRPGAGPSTGGSPGAASQTTQTSLIPRTELDNVHLVTRAAVGLLTEGVDYFLANMREAQAAIDADPQLLLPAIKREQESRTDLLRYLVIGAVLAGERQASQAWKLACGDCANDRFCRRLPGRFHRQPAAAPGAAPV